MLSLSARTVLWQPTEGRNPTDGRDCKAPRYESNQESIKRTAKVMLTITSLLSILFMTFHLSDDMVRGFALGAGRRNVLLLIVSDGMKLAGIGIVIGVAVAFVLQR